MFDKLDEVVERYESLTIRLTDPEVAQNPTIYTKLAKERAEIEETVEAYQDYKRLRRELEESREMLEEESDPELRHMAREEAESLTQQVEDSERRLELLLLPTDPLDAKNTILEIRAGTGGEEAALFAADLFRMYSRYAEKKRWKIEVLSQHTTGVGGLKEVIALMTGKKVYSFLKFESGVHRVQRVPETESQGRIHTSACTVAVLPEAEDVDIKIEERDIRIDFYRSSGPGGQSVNTTDSAVRITHLDTGLVVTCQDEKSQHKNRAQALKILSSRLLDMKRAEQDAKESAERRSQVGSGDRSERIRTYNYPQNRLTDHRVGLTLYQLDEILEGDLEEVIMTVRAYFQAEALRSLGGTPDQAPRRGA